MIIMHSPSSISLLIVVPGGSQFSGGEEEDADGGVIDPVIAVGVATDVLSSDSQAVLLLVSMTRLPPPSHLNFFL